MSDAPRDVSELPRLAPRAAGGHKGDYGRVLVVAGSRGMTGAAVLCGGAALRGGAGLVRVAVPSDVLPIVAAGNPCYMTVPLPDDADGRLAESARDGLLEAARQADVVALGPGLGRSPGLTTLVTAVLEQATVPVVLDADGLNAVVGRTEVLRRRPGPTVLTPHPAEFGRVFGFSTAEVQQRRRELAFAAARDHGAVVLLKGAGTVVTDGGRVYVNATGNPGMATGGTGDVLTGLVAALLGQKLPPFEAAQLGAHLHGRAGDLARDDIGEVAMTASDLLTYLTRAFRDGARTIV
jgi:NAD(P)H-hydrate epimerase